MIELEDELEAEELEITTPELSDEEIQAIENDYWRSASYEHEVSLLIKSRYDTNAELAILRQRDSKPEEFAEYNAYCEECKKKVKALIEEARGEKV